MVRSGSMAMAQVRARFADRSIPGSGVTEAILALGALLVGGATALVIVREPRWAGGLAAGAGVLLAVAGFRVVRWTSSSTP